MSELKASQAVFGVVAETVDMAVYNAFQWPAFNASDRVVYRAVRWPVSRAVGWTIGANPELPDHPALLDFLQEALCSTP